MPGKEENYDEGLTEKICDCINFDQLTKLFRAEYERGRADIAKGAQSLIDAAYQKGRDDYRDELLAKIEAGILATKTEPSKSNAKPAGHETDESRLTPYAADSEKAGEDRSSMERPAVKASSPEPAAPPKPERPAPPEGRKDLGGKINAARPSGLESNIELVTLAINALGGKASAPQVRDWVMKHKWPDAPKYWNSCLYDLIVAGKLARDGINFVLSKPKPQHHVLPTEPVRAPMPEVKPTAGPRPPPSVPVTQRVNVSSIKFEHNDRSTMLANSRQYALAGKLRAAMGKGHISEAFLASQVYGSNTENNRMAAKNECLAMNDALYEVGLQVKFFDGFGLIMQETNG